MAVFSKLKHFVAFAALPAAYALTVKEDEPKEDLNEAMSQTVNLKDFAFKDSKDCKCYVQWSYLSAELLFQQKLVEMGKLEGFASKIAGQELFDVKGVNDRYQSMQEASRVGTAELAVDEDGKIADYDGTFNGVRQNFDFNSFAEEFKKLDNNKDLDEQTEEVKTKLQAFIAKQDDEDALQAVKDAWKKWTDQAIKLVDDAKVGMVQFVVIKADKDAYGSADKVPLMWAETDKKEHPEDKISTVFQMTNPQTWIQIAKTGKFDSAELAKPANFQSSAAADLSGASMEVTQGTGPGCLTKFFCCPCGGGSSVPNVPDMVFPEITFEIKKD